MSNSSDQCALNANGTLKPTAEIDFYFDEDDNVPMAGPTVATKGQSTCSSLSLSLSLCTEYLHQAKCAGWTLVDIWRSFWMLKSETSMDNSQPHQRHATALRRRKGNGRRKLKLVSTVDSWSRIIFWLSLSLRGNCWWHNIRFQWQCLRYWQWVRDLHRYIGIRPWSYQQRGVSAIYILSCSLFWPVTMS